MKFISDYVKFLYIILALYVLILSIKPCCADDDCADMNNSPKTEQTDNHQNEDDCNGHCLPFFTCGSCVGFTFTEENYKINITTYFILKNIVFSHHKFVENFSAKIWQPPKIS